MASESIRKFRESIPVVQAQLATLKENIQKVLDVIDSGKLVSDTMVDSVAESLKACREKEAELRSLASELDIALVDQSFEQIAELVDRVEQEMNLEGLRQVIFDYFRLTTTAQDTLDTLEKSKKEFQKVCRLIGDEFSAAFEPYSRLVVHTKSKKDLSDADYDLISDNLGKKLVRAADRKQLSVDSSADISAWLDGSSDLLQKRESETLTASVLDDEVTDREEIPEEKLLETVIETESTGNQIPESTEEPVEQPVAVVVGNGDSSDTTELPVSVAVAGKVEDENDPSLLGVVDTADGKVKIRIEKDAPVSEAKSSKFTNRAKSQRGAMIGVIPVMAGLHLHPVINDFNSVNDMDRYFPKHEVDYLLSHGYLGIVSFTTDGKEQKYYALSSKTYACLKKADVAKFIRQNLPGNAYSLPYPNDFVPLGSWNALFAYRCKLITDYFLKMDTNYLYDLRRGEPLSDYAYAPRMDKHDTNRVYATGVIPDGDPEGVVPFLADYIVKHNDDCELVLIIEDLKEIARIREMFRSNYENLICKLRFSLVSEPDCYYDAMGNLMDGSNENEKEEEKPEDAGESDESVSSGDNEEVTVTEETEQDMIRTDLVDRISSAVADDAAVNSAEKDVITDSSSDKKEMKKPQESPKRKNASKEKEENCNPAVIQEENLPEKDQENDEYYYSKALEAFCADKPEVGMTLLHTMAQKSPEMLINAERYGYALGDPMAERDNRYHYLHLAFSDPFGETFAYDVLAAATYLRHYFSPTVRQDPYTVGNLDFLKGNLLLKESVDSKNLFYNLSQFVAEHSRGLDDNLLGMAVKHVGREEQIAELCRAAKEWLAEKDNCSCSKTSIVKTRKEIFEDGGDVVRLMKIATGNNKEQSGEARKLIRRFYSNGGVDFAALDEYIKPIAESYEGVSYQPLVQSDWVYLRREISKPVEIVGQWIDLVDNKYVEKENIIADALKLIEACKPGLATVSGTVFDSEKEDPEIHAACQIIRFTAKCLLKRLDGDDTQERYKHYFYINLLREPFVALDDSYIPLIEKPDEEIAKYDMCKRAVQYLGKKASPWKVTVDRIFKYDQENRNCFDFGCARLLKDYLKATDQMDQWGNNDIETSIKTLNSVNRIKQSPNYWEEEFIANLEMAKIDGWLESTQSIKRLVDVQSALYKTNRNYGFFGRSLFRMLDNIRAQAAGLKPGLKKRLENALDGLDETARKLPVFDKIRDAIDKLRFIEADSFLTQVENENLDISLHDRQALGNTFASFMDEYRHYYDDSLNSRYKKLVDCYINSHTNKNAANYKSAVEFLTAWPVETGFVSKDVIRKFVTLLGLPGKDPSYYAKDKKLAIVKFDEEYRTEYDHPIGQFGTRIERVGLDICIVDCSDDVDELCRSIDEMRNSIKVKKTETPTLLVLVDGSILLDVRRQLAGKYAKKLNMDPFIIMDRVAALFIAGFGVATRWQQFLRCSLPFQPENPYYSDPLAEIPPEMFFGRTEELKEIMSTKVARLVYGGRQLGKTALLHQARNHLKEPLTQRWASYVDVKDKNVAQASEVIGKALQEGSEKFFTVTKRNKWTWNILMNELTSRLTYKEDLQDTFFLIIDEADEFIKSSEQNDYRELDDLINLSNRTNNRFKFVLAGLHNVLRFKNSNNRIASKIPARNIRPLVFDDARELLERPLSYLGFDFSSDEGDVIAQIIHTANYFPGLIHFYAHSLIESKHKQFNSMITPFYTLNRDDLLRLLQNKEFRDLRKDRLEMTLNLNEKEAGYYYTIALLLANLYYSSDGHHYSSHGVSAKELLEYARGYNPNAAVSSLSENDMNILLDELKQLYILRPVDEGEVIRYIFARRSFLELLGRSKEVDDKLQAIMMGEA